MQNAGENGGKNETAEIRTGHLMFTEHTIPKNLKCSFQIIFSIPS